VGGDDPRVVAGGASGGGGGGLGGWVGRAGGVGRATAAGVSGSLRCLFLDRVFAVSWALLLASGALVCRVTSEGPHPSPLPEPGEGGGFPVVREPGEAAELRVLYGVGLVDAAGPPEAAEEFGGAEGADERGAVGDGLGEALVGLRA